MDKQDNIYDELNDMFSRQIREKVYDHRTTTDSECWDEIEQRLQPRKTNRIGWLVGGIAAAVAMLTLTILWDTGENGETNTPLAIEAGNGSENNTIASQNRGTADTESNRKNSTANPQTSVQLPLIAQQSKQRLNNKKRTNNINKENYERDSISSQDQKAEQTYPLLRENNVAELPADKSEPTDTLRNNENRKTKTPIESLRSDDEFIAMLDAPKQKSKWTLAAAVGLGGKMGQTEVAEPGLAYTSAYDDSPTHKYPTEINRKEYDEANYKLPLSFGLMARKNINERFGIETGIVYTYLSSDFKSTNAYQTVEASLDLHYLGIPVNAVGYIWNNDRWNVYLAAGAMVEKGLRSTYTQNIYQVRQNGLKAEKYKESIDGLQWSLNLAPGLSYRLNDELAAYAEPRLSYYFDNKQPVSIRTDKSFIFNINAGLRYEF